MIGSNILKTQSVMGSARANNKMSMLGGYNTVTNISNPGVASNNLVVKIIGFKDSTANPLPNATISSQKQQQVAIARSAINVKQFNMKQPVANDSSEELGVTQPAEVFAKMHKRLSLNTKTNTFLSKRSSNDHKQFGYTQFNSTAANAASSTLSSTVKQISAS